MELLLQIEHRLDERCVNDMFNVRFRSSAVGRISDDHIYEIFERASCMLEMQLKRRSNDIPRRDDALLRMQLLLSKPEGEA